MRARHMYLIAVSNGQRQTPAYVLLPAKLSAELLQQIMKKPQQPVIIDIIWLHASGDLKTGRLDRRQNRGRVDPAGPAVQQCGG